VRVTRNGVASGQVVEARQDALTVIPDRFVAADEIDVRVDQHRVPTAKAARRVKIEEDRAASEERFDVAIERSRVEPPELWQKLPLAAGPFEERPHDVWSSHEWAVSCTIQFVRPYRYKHTGPIRSL
jgi:hypothetical protein